MSVLAVICCKVAPGKANRQAGVSPSRGHRGDCLGRMAAPRAAWRSPLGTWGAAGSYISYSTPSQYTYLLRRQHSLSVYFPYAFTQLRPSGTGRSNHRPLDR